MVRNSVKAGKERRQPISRKFNFIFRELTDGDPNNILGLIDYSIYKNDKIRFIEAWNEEHPESECPDEEINHFHDDSMRRIDHYRELAEKRMAAFMEDLVSTHVETYKQSEKEAKKEAKKEALSELIQSQRDGFEKTVSTCQAEVEKLKTTWKDYVLSGVIGSVSFLLLIYLCGLIFRLWWIDIIGNAIKSAIGAQ